jgi:ketosteroid isomerase-like protein
VGSTPSSGTIRLAIENAKHFQLLAHGGPSLVAHGKPAPSHSAINLESSMSPVETIKAAYAAFGRNDPSVLFGAMDPAIEWNEAEGNPLAKSNPYVGPQQIGEGVFGTLLATFDNFSAVPATFIDGGDHVVVLGRYGGTLKSGGRALDSQFCHVYRFRGGKIVSFQQYTDTAQWAGLMP